MTVYNINLGIGWASSGVEYAQSYRANSFRSLGIPAKFIFKEMILNENIQHFTQNLGYNNDEIIWLYQFFTDLKVSKTTVTIYQILNQLGQYRHYERNGKLGKVIIQDNYYATIYFVNDTDDFVHKVEYVTKGCLVRKDYFTYTRQLSEYFSPKDNQANIYLRRFFNEDGSVAFEELHGDGGAIQYRVGKEMFYSIDEFMMYFIQRLQLTKNDIVIIDRSEGVAPAVFRHKGDAKVGVIVHAEHFSQNATGEHILWNNYYEYVFQNHRYVDFYVCATEVQREILQRQFKHYLNVEPTIYAIPVGSLAQLTYPTVNRRAYSLMTASRLAGEKHIDWIMSAVILAKQDIPELTLDVYGEGGQRQRLEKFIQENDASSYIRLRGHHDLSAVYSHYEGYLSASTSEGFGLTLLEAVGSGLAMIGLDVPYGNQTFIKDNGYLLTPSIDQTADIISAMADAIIDLFQSNTLQDKQNASYRIAEPYLTTHVEQLWKDLVQKELSHD